VPLSFGIQSAFDAFIKAGQLRSLAVSTGTRQDGLPGLPTLRKPWGSISMPTSGRLAGAMWCSASS
jgi:hypothetical protein